MHDAAPGQAWYPVGCVSELFAPSCSITKTKRRRFLWAAWWTAPPSAAPFRPPDAHRGGARTAAEALAEAQRQAGLALSLIEPKWAQAWSRMLIGEPAWFERRSGRSSTVNGIPILPPDHEEQGRSVWAILGIHSGATSDEVRAAYRKKALETHPDRGGNAEAFRQVHRAYLQALARRTRPHKKR